jgi:hypothetical protein
MKELIILLLIIIGSILSYPFPDLDISLLGIGNHRYFLFHSVVPVLLVLALLRSKRPMIIKIFNVIIVSLSFGIGIHLLFDVFQSKSVVFPFMKTLIRGTSIDDRLWEGINSFFCLCIGYKRSIQLGMKKLFSKNNSDLLDK